MTYSNSTISTSTCKLFLLPKAFPIGLKNVNGKTVELQNAGTNQAQVYVIGEYFSAFLYFSLLVS